MTGIFRLGWQDLVRGLVLAVLTAVLTSCQQAISEGSIDPTAWDWKVIGSVALAAAVAYLLKNLVSDQDGKVLGKIGAFALAVVAVGMLSGCSSLFAGMAIGGAGGFDGPGAGGIKINDCDGSAQGSVTAMQVEFTCSKSADGSLQKKLTIGGIDPGAALAKALDAQAAATKAALDAVTQLAPMAAQAAATAAAGPAAGLAAKALLTPKVAPTP